MARPHTGERPDHSRRLKMFGLIAAGLLAIYVAVDRAASWTNSLYGEGGALYCAVAVGMAVAIEALLFKTSPRHALTVLGFVRPQRRALLAVLVVSLPLLAFYPMFSAVSGAPLALRSGWLLTTFGVFLQGGLGEEVMWRGYLFRHLREGRSFWRAACLTMLFTAAAHCLLLFTLPLPVAIAAIVISVIISFPMCHLFELDDGAIWSVALLHFLVQGMPKLFVLPDSISTTSTLAWAAAVSIAPLIVFAFRRRDRL